MIEAYPLKWPEGWPRHDPIRSRFNTQFSNAKYDLLHELNLLGAENIVISSNLPLRKDGMPYAQKHNIDDPGIVVYFTLNNKEQCIPCDKWDLVKDNLHAVNLTVGALRGLDRWGAKELVDAAFKGFQALPDYTGKIKYFESCNNTEDLKIRFKNLAKELHPDVGGDPEEFSNMKKQYDELTR